MTTMRGVLLVLLVPLALAARPDDVERWIAGLKQKRSKIQVRSARALERLGPKAAPAVPALRAALASRSRKVRRAVADALGAIGPGAGEAAPDLARLLKDRASKLRLAAATALGRIGAPARSTAEALKKLAAHDKVAAVREAAAQARKLVLAPPPATLPPRSPWAQRLKSLARKPKRQLASEAEPQALERLIRRQRTYCDMVLASAQRLMNNARAGRNGQDVFAIERKLRAAERALTQRWARSHTGDAELKRLLEDYRAQREAFAAACAKSRALRRDGDRLQVAADLLAEGTALLVAATKTKQPPRETLERFYWILGISEQQQWRDGASVAELENLERVLLKFDPHAHELTVAKQLAKRAAARARAYGPPPAPKQLDAIAKAAAGAK